MGECTVRSGRHFMSVIPLLLAVVLLFTACGSGESTQVYDIEHNRKVFTVDQINQTITVDGYVCGFDMSGDKDNTEFRVTYPNGSTYWWNFNGSFGYGGWSEDYDPSKYIAGDVLWDVLHLNHQTERNRSGKYTGIGIFLLLIGAVGAAAPRAMWHLGYGWRYENVEPSDMALFVERAGGVVSIIAGVICLFV